VRAVGAGEESARSLIFFRHTGTQGTFQGKDPFKSIPSYLRWFYWEAKIRITVKITVKTRKVLGHSLVRDAVLGSRGSAAGERKKPGDMSVAKRIAVLSGLGD